MATEIHIGQNCAIESLLRYAERVKTEDGNEYYRFPFWFQRIPGNFEFVIHTKEPADLTNFITHAGLGGDHEQIEKPKL